MALEGNFKWQVQNIEDFKNALDKLGQATNDFRIPFRLISSDFYRSQRKLFTLQSAGLYEDLSPNYKPVKKKNVGFEYPILVGKTRDLSNSTLGKSHRYSIFDLQKQSLTIGSSVPYGKYHQSDKPRTKIPERKFVFIDGGPADKSNDSNISGRRDRWLKIIGTHLEQLISGEIKL